MDSWEWPNSWYKGDKDWSIGGGNGELIFIEITEFDLDHKGWLMCMEERKWGKVIYPSLHSANLFGVFTVSRHCSRNGAYSGK